MKGLDSYYNSLLAAKLRDEDEYATAFRRSEENGTTPEQELEAMRNERDEYLYDRASDRDAWED